MQQKNGLTLIELLVVMLILGALIAIALPKFTQTAGNAKERACESNCDTISSQIELYFLETGSYPANITDITEDPNRFPDGPPECPKGGSYYINSENRAECDHSATTTTTSGSGC